MAACPCGLPADYRQCCGRFHAGAYYLQAPTPEALMWSRYSAYVLGLRLPARHRHPSTRPEQMERFDSGVMAGADGQTGVDHVGQRRFCRVRCSQTARLVAAWRSGWRN